MSPRSLALRAALAVLLASSLGADPGRAAPALCQKTKPNGAVKFKILEACRPEKNETERVDFGSLAGAEGYAFVLVVAKAGGDFSTVADALDAISDASEDARYLVWVAPGVYEETSLVEVDGFVHLRGSGANATVIRSARSANAPSRDAAAVSLLEDARLSDLTVRNEGSGPLAIAIHAAGVTRDTVVEDVVAEAIGDGGSGHYALYLDDAEPAVKRSTLRARGAATANGALGIVNQTAGFPQPLVEGSLLVGGNGEPDAKTCAGNSGSGLAIQASEASPEVRDSILCGDHRGVALAVNGQPRIYGSQVSVSSTNGAFLFEATGGAIGVVGSGVSYVGNKFTGVGVLLCVHSFKANLSPASDGTTPGTACN